jgi:hypothetical protein
VLRCRPVKINDTDSRARSQRRRKIVEEGIGLGHLVIHVHEDRIKDYLVQLATRTKRLKLSNVKFALGELHDPRLPRASLDA